MIRDISIQDKIKQAFDSDQKRKAPGLVEETSLYQLENSISGKTRTTNTSGVTGVSFKKSTDRWIAYIKYKGKLIQLGSFKEKNEAIQARKEAEEILFKPILEKYGKEQKP